MGAILSQIQDKLGQRVNNAMVSYWSPKMECFVYFGQMTPTNEQFKEEEKVIPNETQQNEDPDST